MPEIVEVLGDFDGFAVRYDQNKNPFFRPIMVENLRKLATVEVGRTLLASIAAARPRSRGTFPLSVNVMCVPTHINFTQSGYRRDVLYGEGGRETVTGMTRDDRPGFSPEDCPFWIAGGSSNEAVDQTAANNGTGTVCTMRFSNVQIMTRKGERADPYIVLAHELIHSLHALQGVTIDGRDEELCTTGLGTYVDNAMSENAFRKAFGLALRMQYF